MVSRSHYNSSDPERTIRGDRSGRGWFSNIGAILAVKAELGLLHKRDAGLGHAPVCWSPLTEREVTMSSTQGSGEQPGSEHVPPDHDQHRDCLHRPRFSHAGRGRAGLDFLSILRRGDLFHPSCSGSRRTDHGLAPAWPGGRLHLDARGPGRGVGVRGRLVPVDCQRCLVSFSALFHRGNDCLHLCPEPGR